jgi:DNA-binding CsgD family transcriptional regulator
VYKKLNNIKEKFDVEKIEHAVREAEAQGIIT